MPPKRRSPSLEEILIDGCDSAAQSRGHASERSGGAQQPTADVSLPSTRHNSIDNLLPGQAANSSVDPEAQWQSSELFVPQSASAQRTVQRQDSRGRDQAAGSGGSSGPLGVHGSGLSFGKKPPMPTIRSSEALLALEREASLNLAPPKKSPLGARILRSLSRSNSQREQQEADPGDSSHGSVASRVTHEGADEEDPPTPQAWAGAPARQLRPQLSRRSQDPRTGDHHHEVAGDLHMGQDADVSGDDGRGHDDQPDDMSDSGSDTSSTNSSQEDDLELSDADLEELDATPKPWYRRRFWTVLLITLSILIFVAGIVLRVLAPQTYASGNITAWRWVMLVGLIIPSYWVGEGLAQLIEAIIEWNFFENRRILYYFIGTTRPLARMFKAGFLPVLWLTIFRSQSNNNTTWNTVYHVILRLLLCGFLFTVAMFVVTVAAKLLASYFHKQAFFDKMQSTLKQEYWLWGLSRPRDAISDDKDEDPAVKGTKQGLGKDTGISSPPKTPKMPAAAAADVGNRSSFELHSDATNQPPPAFPASDANSALLPLQPARVSVSATSVSATPPAAGAENDGPPLSPAASAFSGGRSGASHTPRAGTTKSLASRQSHLNRESMKPVVRPGSLTATLASKEGGIGSNAPKAKGAAKSYHSRAARVLHLLRDGRRPRESQGEEEMMEMEILRKPDLATDRRLARQRKMQKVEGRIRHQEFAATFDAQLGQAKAQKSEAADKEAKRLAFYIFWNVKRDFDRNYLVPEDFRGFLPPKKAKEAFSYMDDNGSGRVGQSEVLNAVLQIFRDRRNLAIALKDTRSVIGTLQAVLGIIIHIFFAFFYLLIMQISLDNMWTLISSGILGFSFIFGNSIRNVFESVLTLFVIHPFDVGDTIYIEGTFCVIEEASLNKVVLKRWDGARMWYPNELLNLNAITNVSRTDTRCQWFKVLVDIDTPASSVAALKAVLDPWFEERSTELKPDPTVAFFGPATDPMKVYLAIYFNWQFNAFEDGDRAAPTRHDLYMLVAETLVELGVKYTLPSFEKPRITDVATSERQGLLQRAAPANVAPA